MAKVKDYSKEIESILVELMSLLGVEAKAVITTSEDGYNVVLESAEEFSGLLIGNKGFTLEAIQAFLNVSLKQATGEWVRVNLDVAGWRKKQEDYLENLAEQSAERARTTNEPQNLYNLTASQRRVIHLKLADEKDIATESIGEGQDRYLVVRVK